MRSAALMSGEALAWVSALAYGQPSNPECCCSLPPGPKHAGRRDEPLAELCTRQLAERLCDAGCDRPLLLCLALERAALTKGAVQQVVQQVLAHPVW